MRKYLIFASIMAMLAFLNAIHVSFVTLTIHQSVILLWVQLSMFVLGTISLCIYCYKLSENYFNSRKLN